MASMINVNSESFSRAKYLYLSSNKAASIFMSNPITNAPMFMQKSHQCLNSVSAVQHRVSCDIQSLLGHAIYYSLPTAGHGGAAGGLGPVGSWESRAQCPLWLSPPRAGPVARCCSAVGPGRPAR